MGRWVDGHNQGIVGDVCRIYLWVCIILTGFVFWRSWDIRSIKSCCMLSR